MSIYTTHPMTSNKSFQENFLAENKTSGIHFQEKQRKEEPWGRILHSYFPQELLRVVLWIHTPEMEKNATGMKCLYVLSMPKHHLWPLSNTVQRHRHHVNNVSVVPTPNSNKIHMKSRTCLHSQFQDWWHSLVNFIESIMIS